MRQINRTFTFGRARNVVKSLFAMSAIFLTDASIRAQSFATVLSTNLFQPTAVAVTPLNRYIISDTGNNRIVEFNPDTFAFTVIAGGEPGAVDGQGPDAKFRSPQGLVALSDAAYVADAGNNLIRKVGYTGAVETVAGNVNLAHQADEIGGTPPNAGFEDGPALSARFRNPAAIIWDGSRFYIADTGNRAIRVLDPGTRTVSTLIRNGLQQPTGIALGRNGDLFIVDSAAHSIKRWRSGDAEPKLIAGKNSPFDSGFRNSTVATNALFKTPSSIFYRETKDELVVADTGNKVLRVIKNVSTDAPSVETFANTETAGFDTPVGLTRDGAGIFLVTDTSKNQIRSVIPVQAPRIIDPKVGFIEIVTDKDSGARVAVLTPVTDATFTDDVIIAISGDPFAAHHYTEGPGPSSPAEPDTVPNPTEASPTAPNFVSPSPPSPLPKTLALPRPVLKVKAFSTGGPGEERIPSRVVEATFRFQVATPDLNSKDLPGTIIFKTPTRNAAIWYTLDGSDPVNNTNVNPASLGPLPNGGSIPLVITTNKVVVKARAFRDNFRESAIAIAEFSPTNYVPNRISLGFQHGEASSEFIAAAGQRFFAPVTLSLLPGARAYGLQFNLTVDPKTGPSAPDFGLRFNSMLMDGPYNGVYFEIPPATVTGSRTNITTYYFTNSVDGVLRTNSFEITNVFSVFTDLLFTNLSERLLGVGWIERIGKTNLYNTIAQDLISHSIPHNTIFESVNGQSVPGGFSFIVPSNAKDGDTYTVRIGRPSATADGIAQDIYIQAPGENDFSPVKAVRELRIGTRTYIAGDVAPFRWFNAGDFGDTNILNNDLSDLQQFIAYELNGPPVGSDFYDAMDSCCVTTNGAILSTNYPYADGSETTINQIGFGDGILDVRDLFVSFRRALDPALIWYARFWSNGLHRAVPMSNFYRGESSPLTRQSMAGRSQRTDPAVQTPDQPALRLSIASAQGAAGETLTMPITADISGAYPLRALLFNVVIEALDGSAPPGKLDFVPGELGAPTSSFNSRPGRFAATWLDTDVDGLLGQHLIGTIVFQIPANASPLSIYRVKLERVSASPNGIGLYPVKAGNGVISMSNRPDSPWGDGIPDSWRAQYFGAVFDVRCHPLLDPDNDGLSNMAEYKLGTNPLDPDDNLRVRASASERNMRLRFQTTQGRKYVIEASDSLEPGSWRVVRSEVIGTGAAYEMNEASTGGRLYYRLRLQE